MPTSFQTQVAEATRSSPVGGNLFHQFAHRCAARTNILAIPISRESRFFRESGFRGLGHLDT